MSKPKTVVVDEVRVNDAAFLQRSVGQLVVHVNPAISKDFSRLL